MTFRGRQLNTEPLFVSLASLKQKMSNIRSPEFLKPIAGEHLFQRDRDEPMTFPAENVEQMRREDIFREAPRDRSLTGLVEEQVRTGKEKKSYEKMFIQKYPEKYAQLGGKNVTGQRGLQEAVKKGIITEEEASMFTTQEVMPVFSGMGIIKGMTKPLAQQILKVSKKATEKQIDVAFKKALHNPEVKDILRGLTKESGAKEMDLLTGARDILLKGVPKIKESVKLLKPTDKKLEPLKVFRGGGFDSSKITKQGISFSLDKEVAKKFPIGGKKIVSEFSLSKDAKILAFDKIPKQFIEVETIKGITTPLKETGNIYIKNEQRLINYAKGKGFDVIDLTKVGKGFEKEIRVINPKIVQATKGVKGAEKPFTGLSDLTLKTVEKLKGKTKVSSQYIQDLSNMPELKQAERNLLRETLDDMPVGSVSVKEFADKIKLKLLPLKIQYSNKWESISLPSETRGNIAKYDVHIYQSPIKTSAGQIHFTDIQATNKNYFAHTRVEDLGKPFSKPGLQSETIKKRYVEEETRRIIELQSDLFQKGELEGEFKKPLIRDYKRKFGGEYMISHQNVEEILGKEKAKLRSDHWHKAKGEVGESIRIIDKIEDEYKAIVSNKGKLQKRVNELEKQYELATEKLQPYRNTWHERIIREEIKRATKDGKTKLQFPTGETAMKVEGLGETSNWISKENKTLNAKLTDDLLKVGNNIRNRDGNTDWIITDILEEGKFKAVPKGTRANWIKRGVKNELPGTEQSKFRNLQETFDISGKVDTSNPIYRFYEKEVQKYLKRIRPDMKRIIDPQGISWYELNITAKDKISPIEAFSGLIGGGLLKEKE